MLFENAWDSFLKEPLLFQENTRGQKKIILISNNKKKI